MSKKHPIRRAARRHVQKPKHQLALESLETRQMLSGDAFVEYGGRMVVRGTSGNDQILISRDPSNRADIRATVNGKTFDFPSVDVKQVKVEAGAGNDLVRSSDAYGNVSQPMFFLGATGNDTLVAPTGGDCLIGGYGNDTLVATTGNNYVNVGPGNDRSFSGAGNDTIVSGGGADYIQDAGGTNSIQHVGAGSTIVRAPLPAAVAGIVTGVPRAADSQTATPVPAPKSAPAPVPAPAPAPVPASSPTPSTTTTAPFVIGVWSQPAWSFDKWKARGINTVVGYESMSGTVSIKQFSDAAVAKGLYMIRHPNLADPKSDLAYKNLLGWMQNDEPDYHNTPADVLLSEYKTLKSAAPNMPVFVNFSGSSALWGYGGKTQADYQKWIAAADWIGNDLYPITAHNRPSALDAPGLAVQRLASWSGGKRQFAVIECSDQQLPSHPEYPGATPEQFRAEVFNAVISGATGIIYFPQRIGQGFLYDYMPAGVETEMKAVNARLSRIGAALMTTPNPSGYAITAGSPLRATWRRYNGKTYIVVLNNSAQTVTSTMKVQAGGATSVTVDGENRTIAIPSGTLTDTFKPYEAHVYVAG